MQNNPLIESVRALAERMPIIKTCKPMPVVQRQDGIQFARPQDYDECDIRLVLAALERAERIHQDAVAINAGYKNGIYEIAASDKEQHEMAEAFFADLDAALKEIQ